MQCFWKKKCSFEGGKLTLDAFKSGIFPLKTSQGKELKILLTPK